MIKTWLIHYKEHKTSVTEPIEGPDDPVTAGLEFRKKHPKVKNFAVEPGASHCETYEELVGWLVDHEVSPRDAQGAAQVMVLNPKMPREPWACPGCGIDLNRIDIDKVGNGYYCPKCHTLIQTG